jgi:uncharacterized protein
MGNRLAQETSPYLLQHADNPVDWFPWGEEALQKARSEDKPILLSIGYAACHWCHVMAHESFEDDDTAALMNEHFVNVKVDREERPDLDSIYMNAVVAMTGQGGWPMTVALTPEGEPFFGGTYFPPAPRFGMPSFSQVLISLARAWQEKRDELSRNARQVAAHLEKAIMPPAAPGQLDEGLLHRAAAAIANGFDSNQGGFGRAPKFPQAMTIEFLLRHHLLSGNREALQMAEVTLEKMAKGGMYDQLGGGFARYSTDNEWLVPHFEKMLYDNALLARVYLHAWLITGKGLYRRVVEESLEWVLAEMTDPGGGFYSSMDADSEGEEGRFYVWRAEEIRTTLGETSDLFMDRYGVSETGNWEGKNILHVRRPIVELARDHGLAEAEARTVLDQARRRLYETRARRTWPGIDDKVLTAWNGQMLAAFAEAGRYLERADFTQAAVDNAVFLRDATRGHDGRLLRTWRAGGPARLNAYLEDYAYLIEGLIALYQTTFDDAWYHWAVELNELMLASFRATDDFGFFDTSDDHEELIYRPRDLQDNAVPSGNAMAAIVLLLMSLFTGRMEFWELATESVNAMYGMMVRHPTAFAQWLIAATFALSNPREVAIVGEPGAPDFEALFRPLRTRYLPYVVIAAGQGDSEHSIPLLAGRSVQGGTATAYVCRRFVCLLPVSEPKALAEQLAEQRGRVGRTPK